VLDGARYIKPETFAIDWQRFQDGRLWTGDGTRNEQYFAFGAQVVSAANGTVVSTRDDMPDVPPNQALFAVEQPGDYIGNHVIVQILPEVWAVYAHLQPGSVAVRMGEEVTAGQRLGRLGNSGNSTAPHLHFQLSDGPDPLTSTSLPFVFDRYTLAGTADLEGLRAAFMAPGTPTAVHVEGPPRAETATYPLVLTVQDFP
jgi:murein DD-endopeptidase MepM/ murein hydrolase activator NlpD